MKGIVYIENEKIGEAKFIIIDKTMGGIGGDFVPYKNYKNYQSKIQQCYEEKGIANSDDFNFKILLSDGKMLNPKGGIGITDSKEFDEIYIESIGNDLLKIEMLNNGNFKY